LVWCYKNVLLIIFKLFTADFAKKCDTLHGFSQDSGNARRKPDNRIQNPIAKTPTDNKTDCKKIPKVKNPINKNPTAIMLTK